MNRARAITDCDIRTDGGYIVAPGSIGENGNPYSWLSGLAIGEVPFAVMPESLFSVLRQVERKTDSTDSGLSFKKGSRNSTLFHILNGLAIGGESEANLQQIGLQFGKTFTPPLREKEIISTVESVLKRKKNQAKEIPTVRSISAKDLMTMDLPEPKWIIPGIVVDGLTFLVGKPKHGKSIAVLNIALAVASGGKALGAIDLEQGTAIYLALEDVPRRLKSRIQKMLVDGPAPENLMLYTQWPRMGEGGLARLEEEIAKYSNIRLVIIDTLQMIKPHNTNRKSVYEHDYEAVAAIKKRIADRFNIAVLLVHHLRKSTADDVFDTVSGSLGLTGAADSTMILERITGQADAVLHVTGRDVESKEFALSFQPDILSWQLLGEATKVKASENHQAVFDCILESEKPISPKEIEQRTGISYKNVTRALKALQRDGSIQKQDRGMYIPLS